MNNIIEISSPELKHAVTGLGKIIGRSRSLPVLQSVKFTRDRGGMVAMEATDLESTAICRLKDIQGGRSVQFLVPFEKLQKAAKQSKGKISLYPDEKDCVIIRSFISNTPIEEKVEVPYTDDFPPTPSVTTKPITLLEGVRAVIDEALECASTDSTRYVLNSVYLDVEDKQAHYIVSTNGRQMFSANSFAFDLNKSLMIPTRKFLGWNGWWTEGPAQLAYQPAPPPKKKNDPEEPGWIKITAEQWTFLTKGIVGNYPHWKAVVPEEQPKTVITIPQQAIAPMLEVIARIPGEDQPNYDITLNASGSTLVLQGRNRNQSQPSSVPIPQADVRGKPVVISLNRDYLARALRFGLTRIEVIDALTVIAFKAEGKRLIVAPLRPDAPDTRKPQTASKSTTTPTAPPADSNGQSTPTNSAPRSPATTTPAQSTPEPVNEERITMPKTQAVETQAATETESPMRKAMQQFEKIRETVKAVAHDLTDVLTTLKTAEKEKKASDKETEAFREKLREIQSVRI